MSTNVNMKKSLRERAKDFTVLLPFMEGKEKGDAADLLGTVNTITDYGFLANEDGEAYVAIIVKERPGKFYFGGTVLTDRMTKLHAEGYYDEIVAEGLPVLMTEKKNKKGNRSYTNIEFYPEG